MRLLDVERSQERTGTTKALAVVDRTHCPRCGGPTIDVEANEDALLRHGGYGATRQTRTVHCADLAHCLWGMTTETSEVRPPRVRA